MRLRSLLLVEATKYESLFAAYLRLEPNQRALVEQNIDWARSVLQREDRIIWYLRLFRVNLLVSHPLPDAAVQDRMFRQALSAAGFDANDSDWIAHKQASYLLSSHFFIAFKHLMSMASQIPQIDQYVFQRQAPRRVIFDLQGIESDWQEKQRKRAAEEKQFVTPEDDDEIVMEFPDGWAWWLLDRGYCSAEAKAMGHCGNGGAKTGDRILSLRKKVQRGDVFYWRPSLTFILDNNGRLGEMKGRGNDKPIADYHPYIKALLKSGLVKGIKGGGYLPQNNFALSDLPQPDQDELVDANSGLASAVYLVRKLGPTPEVIERLRIDLAATGQCSKGYPVWVPEGKHFRLVEFATPDALVEEYGSKDLISCMHNFDGSGKGFIENWDFPWTMEGAEFVYDHLPKEIKLKIGQHVARVMQEEDYEEEIDPQSASWVWSVIADNEELFADIIEPLQQANADGERYGAENDCFEDYERALLKGPRSETIEVEYTTKQVEWKGHAGLKREAIVFDAPAWLAISLIKAAQLVDDKNYLQEVEDNGWMYAVEWPFESPYNGWSGFDNEAARDYALETLPSELTDEYVERIRAERDAATAAPAAGAAAA